MRFSAGYTGGNCSDCAWIAAQGEITEDSPARFEAFVRSYRAEYPGSRGGWLFVNSPGGNLAAGLALGRLVRQYGMSVRVAATVDDTPEGAGREFQATEAGICASACVFILMGGVEREVGENSRVGIHQFNSISERNVRERDALSSAQSIVAELSSYTIDMGVSPDVISLASAVPASDMMWLTNRQLEQTHLVTTIQAVEEVEWRLQTRGAALIALAFQPQDNGLSVGFLVECNSTTGWLITVLIPRTSNTDDARLADIAASIESVEIGERWAPTPQFGPYTFRASAAREGILLTFVISNDDLSRLTSRAQPMFVNLIAPHVYYSELSGSAYLMPRSNLNDLIPHIIRSCG